MGWGGVGVGWSQALATADTGGGRPSPPRSSRQGGADVRAPERADPGRLTASPQPPPSAKSTASLKAFGLGRPPGAPSSAEPASPQPARMEARCRAARAPAEAEAGTRARTAAVAAPGGGEDPPARLGALRAPRAPLGCARGGRAGGRGAAGKARLPRRGGQSPEAGDAAAPLSSRGPAPAPPGLPASPAGPDPGSAAGARAHSPRAPPPPRRGRQPPPSALRPAPRRGHVTRVRPPRALNGAEDVSPFGVVVSLETESARVAATQTPRR